MTAAPENDVPLLTLRIQVCRNCVERVPGECHMPGCFYWMHRISEVPEHLAVFVVDEAGSGAGGLR